jgi:hypothetical protein
MKKKTVTFRVLGVKMTPGTKLPLAVQKALGYLDNMKFGDLLPGYDLGAKLGVMPDTFRTTVASHPALADYRVLQSVKKEESASGTHRMLYANKKTIKAYREMVNNGNRETK